MSLALRRYTRCPWPEVLTAIAHIQAVARGRLVRNLTWSPSASKASAQLFEFKAEKLDKQIDEEWQERVDHQDDFSGGDMESDAIAFEDLRREIASTRFRVSKRENMTPCQQALRRRLLQLKAEARAELAYYAAVDAEEERLIDEEARYSVSRRLEAKELDVVVLKAKMVKFEKACEEELRVMIVKKNVKHRSSNATVGVRWCNEECSECGGGHCDGGEVIGVILGWEEGSFNNTSRCVKCAAEDSCGGLLPTDLIA
jgi:hypothetical protein